MRMSVGFLVAVVGCLAAQSVRAESVVLGVGVDPAYSPFYVAQHRGIFQKHGIEGELLKFSNGGEAVDAAAVGQANFAGAAEQTTMIRIARADVRPLAVYEQSGSYIKLLVRSNIESVAAIKSFGVVKGSVSEYATILALEKNNVALSSVKIVYAGPPELPALFARGDIDAYFVWEPWPTLGLQQGGKILATSGDVGYSYTMWLTAGGPWLEAHKDAARAVVAALKEVNEQIVADPASAAADLQAETKLPKSDTVSFLKATDWSVRGFTDKDFVSFDKIGDFMVSQKIVPAKVDYRKAIAAGAL